MNTPQRLRPFRSIRVRVILALVVPVILAVLMMIAFVIYFTNRQGQNAVTISGKILRTQAESYLVKLNQASVDENDLVMDQVRQEVNQLAAYTASLFDHPETFRNQAYWQFDSHMVKGANGQYTNGKDECSSAFVPNFQPVDDQVRRDLEISAYLDFLFESVYKNNPNVEAIYFGTPNNVIRYYPNLNLGQTLPPDFRVTEREWYTGSALEKDPQKVSWWTPVYMDTNRPGLFTIAAMPVYDSKQQFIGVIGLDINLQGMSEKIVEGHLLNRGYSFVIDPNGKAIALPAQGYLDILQRNPNPGEIGPDLNGVSPVFSSLLKEMKAGKSGFQILEVNKNEVFVAYAPMQTTGWSLASVADSKDVLQAIGGLRTEVGQTNRTSLMSLAIPVAVIILIITGLLGWLIANRIARPVQKFAQAAQSIGAGQWDVELPVKSTDEIGILAREMQGMANQLQGSMTQLEEKVAERTRDLEQRSEELHVAAEIARDTTAVHNLDDTLQKAAILIQERFGFYHVGIFLIDPRQEYAILKAATGEAGREMLNRNHRLKIGQTGIVGQTAGTGQPRITPDVEADKSFFPNPLLPETCSEMALPLKTAGQIIGVLDVQSTKREAFNQEVVEILQMLADQLAVAIQNATLFEDMTQALQQLNESGLDYTQNSWRKIIMQRGAKSGYSFQSFSLKAISEKSREAETAIQKGQTVCFDGASKPDLEPQPALAVPLKIRDQIVGAIDLKFEDQGISPEAITTFEEIARRLSLALENTRLLEETQLRTEQLHLLQEITAAAATHLDMADLMQEVTERVKQGFELSHCSVLFFNAKEPNKNGEKSIVKDLIAGQHTTVLYHFSEQPQAERIDSLIHRDELATLLLCPLTTRNEIIGAILMESTDAKRRFTQEEIQLLDQIGLQVSVAIDVARMFEQTQRRAEREHMVAEITTRLRASNDPQEILDRAQRELQKALQTQKVRIILPESHPDSKRQTRRNNGGNGHFSEEIPTIESDLGSAG